MIKFWTAIFLFGALASWSYAETEIEAKIMATFAERHPAQGKGWWLALGPTAPQVMIEIFEKSDNTLYRARLLEGLAWFSDDSRTVEFLKRQAEYPKEAGIRTYAIHSVGVSQGVKEVDFIKKFLTSPDPQVRLAAAETLKRIRDPASDAVLSEYLKGEKASWIVAKIKGVTIKSPQPLSPVATSEASKPQKPGVEYVGVWKGFWLIPARGVAAEEKGLKSSVAKLRFSLDPKAGLSGVLEIALGKKQQKATLDRTELTGSKIMGSFTSEGSKETSWSFDGVLSRQGEVVLLEIHVPKVNGFLIVRKTASP